MVKKDLMANTESAPGDEQDERDKLTKQAKHVNYVEKDERDGKAQLNNQSASDDEQAQLNNQSAPGDEQDAKDNLQEFKARRLAHTTIAHGLNDELEIRLVRIDANGAEAIMPITNRHKQPFGVLHGGATCTLLEHVGSAAASWHCDFNTQRCLGVDIHIRHRKPGISGHVRGVANFLRQEKNSYYYSVIAYNDAGELLSEGCMVSKIVSLERVALASK
ncbi:MAG: PaaI family thioesterase [Coriobacteriales bacterium]|jgi:1,4-dihydroxy-2-naphthoyl-CoA hydrolase|nr:PaaI family thioesterase [Coriobacteriales bacterium]